MRPFALLYFYLSFSTLIIAQKNTNPRAEWFTEARYGMFIHWGVYSGAEGIWKGEKLRYDNDYAEWIYYRNRINKEEYINLLDRFDWESINPEAWVILAKKAGMKYVTLTAKHHDGFALWDSKVGNYDLGDHTTPKRDIVKELAEACRKHGLKIGLYYSHWVDWEHKYGWDHTNEIYPISDEEFDQYWQEKVIPQMRELLTNYGDIGLIWFDMWIHHSRTIVKKEQLLQLKSLIRELQPDCLVNSRLGLSIEEDPDVDFKTLGDNQLGTTKEDFPWQSPATVAHSWGYHALEDDWKSSTTLLQSLINNVSLNGNMMLNIGPRANGDVPMEIEKRLLEIGKWLDIHGSSIYGAQAFELPKDQHDWGRMTTSVSPSGVTKLFCHLYNWPLNEQLKITGIIDKPSSIYQLNDADKIEIPFDHNHCLTTIDLTERSGSELVNVIVIEYNEPPNTLDGLSATSQYGGYSLIPSKAINITGDPQIKASKRFGSVPEHLRVDGQSSFIWKVFIENPGTVRVDISYSLEQESQPVTATVSSSGNTIHTNLAPTRQVVGEPSSNWHVKEFSSMTLGKLTFDKSGVYDIELTLDVKKNQAFDFQWVWLNN